MISYDSEDEEEEEVEMKRCDVCSSAAAIYKCPRCGVMTCSCECCKAHKLDTGCNGKRDRTAFVGMQNFGATNLRNDYHFLEDVLQTKSTAKRVMSTTGGLNQGKRWGKKKGLDDCGPSSLDQVIKYSSGTHSASAAKLVKGAVGHGVDLSLMPSGMSKRKRNCTRYHKNIDKIYWKVHVIFVLRPNYSQSALLQFDLNGVSADGTLLGLTSSRPEGRSGNSGIAGGAFCDAAVDEETIMGVLLDEFLSTTAEQLSFRHLLRGLRAARSSLVCLMQKVPSPAASPLFYDIPLEFTLRSALEGKRVIEHPTFVIGTRDLLNPLCMFVGEVGGSPEDDVSEEEGINYGGGKRSGVLLLPDSEEEGASVGMDQLSVNSPGKRRRVTPTIAGTTAGREESGGLNGMETGGASDEEEDLEEEEGVADVISEEFIRELELLESHDISAIQALISTMESDETAS